MTLNPSLVAALCGALVATAAPSAQAQPAQRQPATFPYGASQPVPGRYIVVFKAHVTDPRAAASALVQAHGGSLRHAYSGALRGFAAQLPEPALNALRNHPDVAWIEQDRTVSLAQAASTQDQAPWGLDRIDQADRPLDTQYHFTGTGAGVHAFVLDTGIRTDHVEFSGRLLAGVDFVADANGTNDCNGHGTHVAGTIAGTTWGVAKGASLVPVRVLDCSGNGSWSGVIAGIDYVANSTLRPAVANLSLGGGISAAVDTAVAGAVAKGVVMVIAAGNSGDDACNYSPAREPSAITVGATASDDVRAFFSNFGSCVDIFAPGLNITSAWNTSASASIVNSGTSMASPHVAGVAALALAANPTASPAAVASFITSTATPNRVQYPGTGSPNLLLYSLGTGTAAAPSTRTVAYKSMAGSASRTGGNWRASAVVTVRDVATGATVANATVTGTFTPGGNSSCVTASSGACTLASGAIKNNAAASTTLTGTGVSGTLLNYDATQNTVSQIVISRP